MLLIALAASTALACSPAPLVVANPVGAVITTNLVAPMHFFEAGTTARVTAATDRTGADFTARLRIATTPDGRIEVTHRPGELNAREYAAHYPVTLTFGTLGQTTLKIAPKAVASGGSCKFTPKVRYPAHAK